MSADWHRRVRKAIEAYDRNLEPGEPDAESLLWEIGAGVLLVLVVGVATAHAVVYAMGVR